MYRTIYFSEYIYLDKLNTCLIYIFLGYLYNAFCFQILHFFNAPTDVCGKAVHRAVSDALCRTDAIRSITIRMHYS